MKSLRTVNVASSMKQTIIKTVTVIFAVHLCIALAIGRRIDVNSYGTDQALTGGQIGNSTPTVVSGANNVCNTPACQHAASNILEKMDTSVKPCDDFYRFACGKFLKETVIPDDKGSVSTFDTIGDKVTEQLRISLEEPVAPNEPKHFRFAKNFYKSCMNTTVIEEKGLEPLRRILKKLGGLPAVEGESWNEDSFNWINLYYKLKELGYRTPYFLSFGITTDAEDSTKRMIAFDQPASSFSREDVSEGLDGKLLKAYHSYMVDVAVMLGAERERAKNELRESLEFEMKLVNISLRPENRRNMTLLYNPMTIAELTETYPSIPWKEFVNRLLPSSIHVDDDGITNVAAPDFMKNFEKLMNKTSKRIQANYGIWRAVATSVSYLNDKIRERHLELLTVWTGQSKRPLRWKECVDIASQQFAESVGALYVKKYFNEDAKKSATEMIDNIRKQFNKIVQEVDWMDNKTRQNALDKEAALSEYIAYPDEILDDNKVERLYEGVEINEDDYLQGFLNMTIAGMEYSWSKLKQPINKSDWMEHLYITEVNAGYSPSENSIYLPAGILQDAFFSYDRPSYMNYGGIGCVVAHEIIHAFDDEGRQYDKNGNLVDWWEQSTKDKYLAKAQCIIDQYSNYTVEEIGLNLKGINTQSENIADNGGMKAAYLAYKDWSDRNGPDPMLPNLPYTPRQMFWLSAANILCTVYRPEDLKIRINEDPHSPDEFRILGSFSNMPEFAEDFECPVGSKMNPENKCSMW